MLRTKYVRTHNKYFPKNEQTIRLNNFHNVCIRLNLHTNPYYLKVLSKNSQTLRSAKIVLIIIPLIEHKWLI